MKHPRFRIGGLLVALILLMSGSAFSAGGTRAASAARCFPGATDKCISGIFRDYWEQHGDLALNGYPLSDQRLEALEDGRIYTVQYFERVRMEYHPENDDAHQVLLGQFGRRMHPLDPAAPSNPPRPYFPETGHNVAPDFFAFWQDRGGLAQFGYPLTEEFQEQLEDNNTYTVQYFERARFERHYENAAPYDILLGQFGRSVLATTTPANIVPCQSPNVTARSVTGAGAGQRYATVYLTNNGNAPCSLSGAPDVQLRGANGDLLPVNFTKETPGDVDVIVVPPGLQAQFSLKWSNWCGPDPGAVTILATLPNGTQQIAAGGMSVPPCLGEGQPSNLFANPFSLGPLVNDANVVLSYVAAINAHDYQHAYSLLGPDIQAAQRYSDFVNGFATTAQVRATIATLGVSPSSQLIRVGVTLDATQTDNSVRHYNGYYEVGAIGGALRLANADIVQSP